ncbi:MAG TPA: NAD-dependent epimerase/dehydratase family protein [Casimicrobiaceae bacterium]|nr:NAD-dependent epimerase/dehydratase family protein [Casimicrobiaceae bacterium]
MAKSLVIGANGQIGSELVAALARRNGEANVIAADVVLPRRPHRVQFVCLDVLDSARLREIAERHDIGDVYLLAALLSARGESAPLATWTLNVNGLLNVLELAREKRVARVFWPSSIAAFGPHSPADGTPQWAVMDPTTMYGASKEAGERLCEYYFGKFGVDVRSVRYPGVIGYGTPPGGGTTDYAVAIFQAARRGEVYRCFLAADTILPMIYMPDAIRAALDLMDAHPARIRVRSSYNLAGLSFSPAELASEIRRHVPSFQIAYEPDYRQKIADSWPRTIDDAHARADWGWTPKCDLSFLVAHMLENVPVSWDDERVRKKAS